jgi:BirA family biotin operon repressor/biotin-[acetyl-CoA-carboxylase] ligase
MDRWDHFDVSAVRRALVGTRFAHGLQHFASVGSTNALLLEAAAAGAAEGTAYVADEQTAGRGRGGHSWHSTASDGLYVSALVQPALRMHQALLLSLATGLAAQSAIAASLHPDDTVPVDIRWPNDLLAGSKKCGGILVETAVEPERGDALGATLRYAVIGVGINVNHHSLSAELSPIATSLRMLTGRPLSRQRLLVDLLRALDAELTRLETPGAEGVPRLLERFAAASTWIRGKRVSVPEQGGYTGVTAGLDARGFLLVDGEDGMRRTVLSGGVREFK